VAGALALALGSAGCSGAPLAGAFWGNLLVLGVTVGIFFGTLALGRSSAATQSAEASSTGGSSTAG
jgi:ABC-type Na+ efflux pump permease subunit